MLATLLVPACSSMVEQLPLKQLVVGSSPTGRTRAEFSVIVVQSAGMAKLVDALALGASGVTHGGSSPLPSTVVRDFVVRF